MKRIVKVTGITAGVIAIVVIALVAVVANAFLGRRAITDGYEINGIRIVKDGIVSIAMIPLEGNKIALIDAGNDKSGKAILQELSRRNLGPDDVTAILITHGHADHIGALPLFPNAQIMALEPDVAMIEGRAKAHGPLTRFMANPMGVKVTRALHDGDTVNLGDVPVQVFAVPGHTQGSAAYLVDSVLFMGDAADVSTGGKLQGSPWIFSDSTAQDRTSLVDLEQRLIQAGDGGQVKALEFAHSGVLAEGLQPLIAYAQQNPIVAQRDK